MEILSLQNINFSYPGNTGNSEKALSSVSFSVKKGEFLLLSGTSGSGKTTLIRLLKREIVPHGDLSGEIRYLGEPLPALSPRDAASSIGYVGQDPSAQLVTDKVWHELAFGLESLGLSRSEMRRRIAEMASFFGISHLFSKSTNELSGGEKQLVNLCAVMLMRPQVLLLDEPCAQLDPVGTQSFLSVLEKLRGFLGLTVIMAEHRLEDVLPLCDRVCVLEGGRVYCIGPPKDVAAHVSRENHPMLCAMPVSLRVSSVLGGGAPLFMRDGQQFLEEHFLPSPVPLPDKERPAASVAIKAKNLWFRYEKEAPDVLAGASFSALYGEIFAFVGGNGAGKSTLLHILAGTEKPFRGKVQCDGRPLLLPQNPAFLFVKDTLREDLCTANATEAEEMAERFGLLSLLDRHPDDLSGGEKQKAALCKLLLYHPKILLLDEPTKGMDAAARHAFGETLLSLRESGVCIVLVTHDLAFTAEYADRVCMLFGGEIIAEDGPRTFFSENHFYTTPASVLSRHLYQNAVTSEDVISLCKQNKKENTK